MKGSHHQTVKNQRQRNISDRNECDCDDDSGFRFPCWHVADSTVARQNLQLCWGKLEFGLKVWRKKKKRPKRNYVAEKVDVRETTDLTCDPCCPMVTVIEISVSAVDHFKISSCSFQEVSRPAVLCRAARPCLYVCVQNGAICVKTRRSSISLCHGLWRNLISSWEIPRRARKLWPGSAALMQRGLRKRCDGHRPTHGIRGA